MAILELDGVSKKFGALTVAEQISFAVCEGEALGIIGPNGAVSKSTLFNLITGNIAADSGSIRFLGSDVTRTPPMARCLSGMGRTFQIPQPFEKLTVFENLLVVGAFGSRRREAEVSDRCAEILVDTGLIDKANVLAGGLSLLQRKRLELARALATEPKLLLLDEIARRTDRGRMPVVGCHDPRHSCARRCGHLDRACAARAEFRRRAAAGAALRQGHRHRQAAGHHGLARCARNLSGDRDLMALLETRGLTASYGDFQALFGVDITVGAKRNHRHHRRQRRLNKTTLMRSISGVLANAASSILYRDEPIGAPFKRLTFWRAALPWCRKGESSFHR